MARSIVSAKDFTPSPAPAACAAPQMKAPGNDAVLLMTAAEPVAAAPASKDPDDYKTRLLKYIPAEVVSLYIALETVVKTAQSNAQLYYWIIFVIGIVGTPLYLWKQAQVTKGMQLGISTLAFVIWVFALGGPFESYTWYQNYKLLPAIILPAYTFFVATIEP